MDDRIKTTANMGFCASRAGLLWKKQINFHLFQAATGALST